MATFNGTSGPDVIGGTESGDTINGQAGDDLIGGFGGNDTIRGGAGDDQVVGGTGNDNIRGEGDDDLLLGELGADTIDGGDGNDILGDNDIYLSGGVASALPDTYRDDLRGGNGNDSLSGGVSDIFDGGAGNDIALISLVNVANAIVDLRPLNTGGAGTLPSSGTIRNVEGGIAITFGNGTNTAYGSNFFEEFFGGSGVDTFDGGGGGDTIYGGFGNDVIQGGDGVDILNGEDGTDTIRGGAGDDTIEGGNGADQLFGDDGADTFNISIGDSVDGGAGIDTVTVNGIGSLPESTLDLRPLDSGGVATLPNGMSLQNVERITLWTSNASTTVMGSGFVEIINGYTSSGGAGDFFYGGGGDDVIRGGAGDDLIAGGAGDDTLDGQTGSRDLVSYADATSGVTVSLNIATAQNTGGGGTDTIAGFEGIVGSDFDDTLFVSGSNTSYIYGGGGDDLIRTTNGDQINGGAGVDATLSIFSNVTSGESSWMRRPDGSWYISAAGFYDVTDVEIIRLSDRDVVLDNAQQTFTGDGTSDILWRNASGLVAVWHVNGSAQTGSWVLGPVGLEWTVGGTGDFDGDDTDDIIWRDADGTVAIWDLSGGVVGTSLVTDSTATWAVAGVGDFNFDTFDDVLWRDEVSGEVNIWTFENGVVAGAATLGSADVNAWHILAAADFNGDGRDEILWRNNDGLVATWETNGAALTGSGGFGQIATDWNIRGTGDFNGDGRADVLWQRDDGLLAIWHMNGSTILSQGGVGFVASPWYIADIGDYNGDGHDDILWRDDGSGFVAIWTLDGFTVTSTSVVGVVNSEWGII